MQKEGVAIETQGITFVTNGKKRDTLTVSDLKPYAQPLASQRVVNVVPSNLREASREGGGGGEGEGRGCVFSSQNLLYFVAGCQNWYWRGVRVLGVANVNPHGSSSWEVCDGTWVQPSLRFPLDLGLISCFSPKR